MARILVAGETDSLAPRLLVERLVETIRAAGHDAQAVTATDDPQREVREADGVVALVDSASPGVAAIVAFAHAHRKPVLGCMATGAPVPRFLRSLLTQSAEVRKGSELQEALERFYDRIKPFAGRLVRDKVPDLVRQAGHEVRFRRVGPEDLPRFLKRKVAEEAQALDEAAGGREKEEVADLLEALEALIQARGYDKDDLKRIKRHKLEERGGFGAGYVVEAALISDGARSSPPQPPAPAPPADQTSPRDVQATGYDGPTWEADDAVPVREALARQAEAEPPRPERPVRAELRDL